MIYQTNILIKLCFHGTFNFATFWFDFPCMNKANNDSTRDKFKNWINKGSPHITAELICNILRVKIWHLLIQYHLSSKKNPKIITEAEIWKFSYLQQRRAWPPFLQPRGWHPSWCPLHFWGDESPYLITPRRLHVIFHTEILRGRRNWARSRHQPNVFTKKTEIKTHTHTTFSRDKTNTSGELCTFFQIFFVDSSTSSLVGSNLVYHGISRSSKNQRPYGIKARTARFDEKGEHTARSEDQYHGGWQRQSRLERPLHILMYKHSSGATAENWRKLHYCSTKSAATRATAVLQTRRVEIAAAATTGSDIVEKCCSLLHCVAV